MYTGNRAAEEIKITMGPALDFRFYMLQKDIEAKSDSVKRNGTVLPFENKRVQTATMIEEVHKYFQQSVLVVTDSWFGNNGRWSRLDRGSDGCFHLLFRMRTNITLYNFAPLATGKRKASRPRNMVNVEGLWVTVQPNGRKEKAQAYTVFLYGKKREVQAYSQIVMLKTMKCPVRVVWAYRKTRNLALMTTDLSLSVEQIIEYHGAHWEIKSRFKEIKQEVGSVKSQIRNADTVLSHLNFFMMATTLT